MRIAEDRLALPGENPRFYESRRKQVRRIDAGGGADKRISFAGMKSAEDQQSRFEAFRCAENQGRGLGFVPFR